MAAPVVDRTSPESPPRRGAGWRSWLPLLLAVPPMLWLAGSVRQGSRLPYYDYWIMVEAVFRPDGGLDASGLLTFQNEHPVVVPDLVYWVNAHLTGGSNVALGLVVLAVVLGTVAVVSRFPAPEDRTSAPVLALVAVAGVLLFSRQGAHLFFAAYSAPMANLFAAGAILARHRGRTCLAIGLGVGASLCNAAGLAVWPAIVVTGLVRDRDRRRALAVGAYGMVLVVGYLLLRNPPTTLRPGPDDAVRSVLSVLGAVLTTSIGLSQVLGAVLLVIGLALGVAVLRARRSDLAPWVGLVTYAVVAAGLIGSARWRAVLATGLESRYTSPSALAVIGVLGLLLLWDPRRRAALLAVPVVAVLALPLGGDEVDRFLDTRAAQDELAAALRLDLADGYTYLPYYGYPRVAPILEGFGHHPFDGRWDGDCGLLGHHASATPDPAAGTVAQSYLLDNERGVRVLGEVAPELAARVECVLVADPGGRVIGAGAMGVQPRGLVLPEDRGFAAVAPLGPASYQVLVVLADGTVRALDDPVLAPPPA